MDFMMNIAYENIPSVKEIFDEVPINNVEVWTLLNHLTDEYADFPFDKILGDTFLHKLNWRDKPEMTSEGSVIREILRRYA